MTNNEKVIADVECTLVVLRSRLSELDKQRADLEEGIKGGETLLKHLRGDYSRRDVLSETSSQPAQGKYCGWGSTMVVEDILKTSKSALTVADMLMMAKKDGFRPDSEHINQIFYTAADRLVKSGKAVKEKRGSSTVFRFDPEIKETVSSILEGMSSK